MDHADSAYHSSSLLATMRNTQVKSALNLQSVIRKSHACKRHDQSEPSLALKRTVQVRIQASRNDFYGWRLSRRPKSDFVISQTLTSSCVLRVEQVLIIETCCLPVTWSAMIRIRLYNGLVLVLMNAQSSQVC